MRVLTRNHHGHVVVEDLDREVVTGLSHDLLGLTQENYSGAVVRIDDVVALLEGAFDDDLLFELDLVFDS
jgi:hypothetical protein